MQCLVDRCCSFVFFPLIIVLISGYLMARQGKQKQNTIPSPAIVGQAQATVSNIYIFTL
jgi:hypothetical protein